MKRLALNLLDGEHFVSTPTFATLQIMEDLGIDFASLDMSRISNINKMVAAMLTSAEPLDNGVPRKTWTALEAGALMDQSCMQAVIETITALITDAFPDVEAAVDDDRPTKASRPAAKR